MVRVEGIREVRGTAYTSVQGWSAAAMGIHELPSIKVVCAAFKRCTTFLAVGVGRIATIVVT